MVSVSGWNLVVWIAFDHRTQKETESAVIAVDILASFGSDAFASLVEAPAVAQNAPSGHGPKTVLRSL